MAPKVLLRFPGPCGIRDCLQGRLRSLAGADTDLLYLSAANIDYVRQGAELFGSLLVFNPLKFQIVETAEKGVYIGLNALAQIDRDASWIPPRLMKTVIDWTPYSTLAQVQQLVGDGVEDEKFETLRELNAYFEEISALVQSSLPLPKKRWYELDKTERLGILESLNFKARWSTR